MESKNTGLAIHCHHDILIEYCWNFEERIKMIKQKPKNEIKTRLRLFKILPAEALNDLPAEWKKAYDERVKACDEGEKADAEWKKADAEWTKACDECEKACDEWEKACDEWVKADDEWKKADAEWTKACDECEKACDECEKACDELDKADKEKFHAKWCGCKEWNGKEIVFNVWMDEYT